MKYCKYCNRDKPKQDFGKRRGKCKACVAIYNRRWYTENRTRLLVYKKEYNDSEKGRRLLDEYNAKNKKKVFARASVQKAVRRGELIKPDSCITCGVKEKIQAHHIDYDEPLLVLWLCKSCHYKLHRTSV